MLLRYITEDDPAQAATVRELLARAEELKDPFYISTIAVCELAWTLRGSPYHFDRTTISAVIEKILGMELFEVQDRNLVRFAIADYRKGRADFPDYLLGWQNRQAGCEDTLTFDRKLRGVDGYFFLA